MIPPVRTTVASLDDAGTPAARTALGLGSAATQPSTAFAAATHTHATSQIVDLGQWAGSTSIATLGTVATGTWQAGKIAVAYLGSGTPAAGKYLDGGGTWTTLPAGGGGLAVGSAVSGGGANRVLYQDGSGNLAASANLAYAAGTLVHRPTGTADLDQWVESGGSVVTKVQYDGSLVSDRIGDRFDAIFRIGSADAYRLGSGYSFGFCPGPTYQTPDAALSRAGVGSVAVTDNGLGGDVSLRLRRKSSTTADRDMGGVVATAIVNTDATRAYRVSLVASGYNGDHAGVTVDDAGSAALVGFFGSAPVARPAVSGSRGGNAALASLISALASLGLVTDSTTA